MHSSGPHWKLKQLPGDAHILWLLYWHSPAMIIVVAYFQTVEQFQSERECCWCHVLLQNLWTISMWLWGIPAAENQIAWLYALLLSRACSKYHNPVGLRTDFIMSNLNAPYTKKRKQSRNAPSNVTANTHSAQYFWSMQTAVLTAPLKQAVLCVFKACACEAGPVGK